VLPNRATSVIRTSSTPCPSSSPHLCSGARALADEFGVPPFCIKLKKKKKKRKSPARPSFTIRS